MMKRCLFLLATALPLASSLAHSQALPAVTRGGTLQAGIELSNGSTDYFTSRITGISGYATFDLTNHLGVEIDYHSLTVVTPQDYSQSSFEGGIRYVYPIRRYQPYAKLMAGVGGYNANRPYAGFVYSDSFNMYSYGAGLDIRFSHRINVRAIDFELQNWPGYPPNGLTPSIISVGVAYRIR